VAGLQRRAKKQRVQLAETLIVGKRYTSKPGLFCSEPLQFSSNYTGFPRKYRRLPEFVKPSKHVARIRSRWQDSLTE
jgi:hypothetical protein